MTAQNTSLESIVLQQMIDMGGEFAGVLCPVGWSGGTGVTKQFLDDAENYHQKYFDTGYAHYLLDEAMAAIKPASPPALILDVGSGSGTSVVALLEKFPDAHVVATDVSPQLLAILRREIVRRGMQDRCTTLCVDLNTPVFAGRQFDLAIGSAILHHLFDPEKLLRQVFAATKGAMAYFEPFETGYAAVGLIYRIMLAQISFERPMTEQLAQFFARKIAFYRMQQCTPKDPVVYADIDDKWMFTRQYFEDIADRLGARVSINALHDSETPFADHIRTDLRLGLALDADALPAWAYELVADIEGALSPSCKSDLAVARCVVFAGVG